MAGKEPGFNARPRPTGPGQAGADSRRINRRRFLRSGLIATGALATALYVRPEITTIGVPKAFAAMSPPPEVTPAHRPSICVDFDESLVHQGDVITHQYATYGFQVSTQTYWGFSNPHHPAVIFNTASPTGGDQDLGTPNVAFGGPGMGAGGGPGPGANQFPQGQVLIIHEGWTPLGATWVNSPDDHASGGRLVFTFNTPVTVTAVQLLNIDDNPGYGNRVRTYSAPLGGLQLFDQMVPSLGGNSFQTVSLNDNPTVRRLEVILRGGGAVARLCYQLPW